MRKLILRNSIVSNFIGFNYTIDSDTKVSAIIQNARGELIRTVFVRKDHAAGNYNYNWDGFDNEGNQQPNGIYYFRYVSFDGFKSKYRLTAGTSLPEYYQMPGQHSHVRSISAGDSNYLVIGNRGDATSPDNVAVNKDGTAVYAEGDSYGGGGKIASTIAETVSPTGEADKNVCYYVWTDSTDASANAGLLSKIFSYKINLISTRAMFRGSWDIKLTGQSTSNWVNKEYGIAAKGDEVVVAYTSDNFIRWIDTKILTSGSNPQPLVVKQSLDFFRPKDVVYDGNDILISNLSGIFRYNTGTRILNQIIDQPDCTHLDINQISRDIYVAVNSGNTINRYDNNGNFIRSYGDNVTRTDGLYNPTGFCQIEDLACVDSGFWIIDTYPRRVAYFLENGEHVRDLWGPQTYNNASFIDQKNQNRLWIESSITGGTFALLDCYLNKNNWSYQVTGIRTIPRMHTDDDTERMRTTIINNTQYFYFSQGKNGSFILKQDGSGNFIILNKFNFNINFNNNGLNAYETGAKGNSSSVIYTNSELSNRFLTGDYAWSNYVSSFIYRRYIDKDLNFYYYSFQADKKIYKLPTTGFNTIGAPLYPPINQSIPIINPSGLFGDAYNMDCLYSCRNGDLAFLVFDTDDTLQGQQWSDTIVGKAWLARFNRSGQLLWKNAQKNIRNITTIEPPLPGKLCEPRQIAGEVNDILVVTDRIGSPGVGYTRDGICLGNLMENYSNAEPDYVYKWWDISHYGLRRYSGNPLIMGQRTLFNYDLIKGSSINQVNRNEAIWIPQGRNNSPIFEVSGFDINIKTSKIKLSKPNILFNGNGLSGYYYNNNQLTGSYTTRLDQDLKMWFVNYSGLWNANSFYTTGAMVHSGNSYYYSIASGINRFVTNSSYWYPIPTGYINISGGGRYRATAPTGTTNLSVFSVRWSGQIKPFHNGIHYFMWEGDPIKLWIDNQLIIDLSLFFGSGILFGGKDSLQGFYHKVSSGIYLNSNQSYSIRIDYSSMNQTGAWRKGHPLYQEGYAPRACLWWETDGLSARMVDQKYLYS